MKNIDEDGKNKPHADWTYLLMKVRKSAANNHVNERTNERTNVKTISLKLLCEKEQRNKWKKSKENLQERRFPAYFRHFRPEKNFYHKSDSAML